MITHLGHTAIVVQDLDRALRFYCDQLGLKEGFRLTNDMGDPWLVYVLINETTSLELFPGAQQKGERRFDVGGPNHLCLLVDDIHRTLNDIRSRGLALEGEPTMGEDGNWQFWLEDPDGTSIELMQMMPGCLQEKAAERVFG